MSLIKNLVRTPEKSDTAKGSKGKKNSKNDDVSDECEEKEKEKSEGDVKPRFIVKSFTDLQRHKLEKLMKNPEKPIIIPEPRKEKDYMQTVPTFVRNVMGSSAGAGSGEFHVYRHLRRKEYARQKTIQAKSMKEQLDEEYKQKLDDNRRMAEEKTAKKRAKRLKKKQRAKRARKQEDKKTEEGARSQNEGQESSSEDEDSNDEVDLKTRQECKTGANGEKERTSEGEQTLETCDTNSEDNRHMESENDERISSSENRNVVKE